MMKQQGHRSCVQEFALEIPNITLKDKNPFLYAGHELVESTRLYIRNIPCRKIRHHTKLFERNGSKMLGILKYVRARTPD